LNLCFVFFSEGYCFARFDQHVLQDAYENLKDKSIGGSFLSVDVVSKSRGKF
jgi:hypothetical protein